MAERLPSKRWALRRRALTLPLRTVQPVETSMDLAPKNHSQPRGRGVQFQIGAVLQHSITPSLRVAGFEDEDENEAPREASLLTVRVTQSRGQRLLDHVVYRLGDDLVPDHRRVGGIPEKELIRVRHHRATMR